MTETVIENCVFVGPEHKGHVAELLRAAVNELRDQGSPLPPFLAEWNREMSRLDEYRKVRCKHGKGPACPECAALNTSPEHS